MKFDSREQVTLRHLWGQNKGQLIVEYILLLLIVTATAALLTSAMVGRGDDSSGFMITKWNDLVQMVASDMGD